MHLAATPGSLGCVGHEPAGEPTPDDATRARSAGAFTRCNASTATLTRVATPADEERPHGLEHQ